MVQASQPSATCSCVIPLLCEQHSFSKTVPVDGGQKQYKLSIKADKKKPWQMLAAIVTMVL